MLPSDLSTLRVVDLRAELSKRNLATKGKKDELVARLQEAVENEAQQNAEDQAVEKSTEEKDGEQKPKQEEKATEEETSVEKAENKEEEKPVEEAKVTKDEKPAEEPTSTEESKPEEEANPVEARMVEEESKAAEEPKPEAEERTGSEETDKPAAEEKPVEQHAAEPDEEESSAKQSVTEEESKQPSTKATKSPDSTKEKETAEQAPSTGTAKEQAQEDVQAVDLDTDRGTKRKRSEDKTEEEKQVEKRARSTDDQLQEKTTSGEKGIDNITHPAIYIKGFVRPLITKNVQALIGKYGTVKRFWMDAIKTHCYVIYETTAEAREAYAGINGLVFNQDSRRPLAVGGLTPEQAETLIEYEQEAAYKHQRYDYEAAIDAVCRGEGIASSTGTSADVRRRRLTGIDQITKQLQKSATSSVLAAESSAAQEVPTSVSEQPASQQQSSSKTLDDLFRKTQAVPPLYYLPVSDEIAHQRLEKFKLPRSNV